MYFTDDSLLPENQAPLMITAAPYGPMWMPGDCTPEQKLPVTWEEQTQIAVDCYNAGATLLHIHVRDPKTTRPSMDKALYREVVERIREKNDTLILNLTTGPGGRFAPSDEDPKIAGPGTNFVVPEKRVEHVAALRPEICTLDLNTMTFGKEVDAVLGLPEGVTSFAILPIGYPEGKFGPVGRNPIETFAHQETWGTPFQPGG